MTKRGEVTLTRSQAAKVYDRAFAGRESELHEGHPSWAAFQRFLKAGYGPTERVADLGPRTPQEAELRQMMEQPEGYQGHEVAAEAQAIQRLVEAGATEHEAKLILAARSATRVQDAPEGTVQGQQQDTRLLERYHAEARQGGFSGGSY